MISDQDEITSAFIEFSGTLGPNGPPVLDVGAAYGVVSQSALGAGAIVIANDSDPAHLWLLRKSVLQEWHHRLHLKLGNFPAEVDFPHRSLGAILLRRVAHFFTPDEMELAIKKAYDWLAPGGKIFIVTMTHRHHKLMEFSPTYEMRWKRGERWPGVVSDLRKYFPELGQQIPQYFHALDERPLVAELGRRGFKVTKVCQFDYERSNSYKRCEKAYCGVAAIKQ